MVSNGVFNRWRSRVAGLWVISVLLAWPAGSVFAAGAPLRFEEDLKPFLGQYCIACHGAEKKRADLDLQQFESSDAIAANRELWEKVRKAIEEREMPPDNRPQPAEALRQSVVKSIDAELARLEANEPPNPGAVTLRRLNRNEYRNTVRDLLGVDYRVEAEFPHDESGYGFDNIGDVLSLSPMLLEKYLAAAETIAAQVISTEDPARQRIRRIPASRFSTQADAVSTVTEEVWGFYREGEIVAEHRFPAAGEYRLRLSAYGEQAGPELPKLAIRLDGRELHVQSVRALEGAPEAFEVPVQVGAGDQDHKLGIAYLNNFNADGDRNVFLASVEVIGPLGAAPEEYPDLHRRVIPRRPEKGQELAYAAEILRPLASRAYRRPATEGEVERLVRLVRLGMEDGAGFEAGVRLALQGILVSPHFLYRWELDPPEGAPGGVRELTDYEVASRLSYFLWSSMPDDELYEVAGRQELRRRAVLLKQVRRMLADPRAEALVDHFGGQWLQVRGLAEVEPDPTVFPGWSPELRDAMREETRLFLKAIMAEDRSIKQLLDADFTFLNERLAAHYGIAGVQGPEFRRVNLPEGSGRGGVLTMGSVLTVTSVPTRTAPVIRGKWILEQILGTPPPPPPPDVPPIEEGAEASRQATLRQRLELHRSKPDCMTCHQKMDPLGFALENFDGIGAWRDHEGPHPIDSSAQLPGGRQFTGATGLKEVLRDNEEFPRALAAKLLTYALGRGLEHYDRRAVRGIVEGLVERGHRFSALVEGVVTSEPFLKRRPAGASSEHASLE